MSQRPLTLSDIHLRDPFVLPDGDHYYLYGSRAAEAAGLCTGLDVYVSEDLIHWSEAHEVFTRPEGFWSDRNFWAPEVHRYQGSYYMFVTFKSATHCRGTQILKAESPMGPFLPYSDGPVTPKDWECLDGTLYLDQKGKPYMVFCHEWLQVVDGEMCAIPLSDDLKEAAGEPFLLFHASDSPYVTGLHDGKDFITDGPFFHRTAEGRLLMLWSSFSNGNYCELIAASDNGELDGNWDHSLTPLFATDGGHGMLFSKEGELQFIMHSPNCDPKERPRLTAVVEENGTLCLK